MTAAEMTHNDQPIQVTPPLWLEQVNGYLYYDVTVTTIIPRYLGQQAQLSQGTVAMHKSQCQILTLRYTLSVFPLNILFFT